MVARYEDTALGLRLLRMGGVTDVLTLRKETAPGLVGVGEAPTVFSEPVHVFRVPAPLPRAYLAGQARAVAGDDALRALGDVGFDPTTTVILDADAPLSAASGSGGSARIVEARADRWRVATQSAAAGYLVVLDADDPGWRAAVDGAAAPVRRANLLFRAVEVPAGAHMVEMTYRPPSVSVGLGLSGAAAVVSLALLRRAA